MVCLAGIGISLFEGAVFAGICISFFPVAIVGVSLFGKQVKVATFRKVAASKQLGGIVEESLSALKVIVSFAQEDREL